jgi:transcriptional regulator with XRE-family HTH domain
LRKRGVAGSLRVVTIGAKLKQARGPRSQEDIAYAAGVAVSTLQRIEAGDHEPRLATIRALAPALGVSVAELVED